MTQPSWNLPDAVLFDMDGTLLDSEQLHWESAMQIIAEHRQREAPAPLLQDWIGWNESTFWDAMRKDFGLGPTNEELTDLRSAIFERMFVEEGPRWMLGAIPLLETLSRAALPMAVVTAAPRKQLDLVAERADFGRWFKTWLSGETDSERSKPHPDPYLEAARRLGVSPERCLAIEDSPTGAESASAAGCYTIAVPSLPLPAERFRVAHKLMLDLRELRSWLLDRASPSDQTQRAVLPR
jgi:HAD superfamily hydrolase (TIGR01509 family)